MSKNKLTNYSSGFSFFSIFRDARLINILRTSASDPAPNHSLTSSNFSLSSSFNANFMCLRVLTNNLLKFTNKTFLIFKCQKVKLQLLLCLLSIKESLAYQFNNPLRTVTISKFGRGYEIINFFKQFFWNLDGGIFFTHNYVCHVLLCKEYGCTITLRLARFFLFSSSIVVSMCGYINNTLIPMGGIYILLW